MSYGDGYGGGYGGTGSPDGIWVEIDWQKSGVWTDETVRVRPVQAAISAQYGRDQSTALAPTVSGTGSFTLDNSDKRFSPRNSSSPLFGYLKPARPVRIRRSTGGGTSTLFVGHTDDSPINPDVSAKNVSLSLVDSLADFRGQTIHTELYRGIRTGEAIGYILDACGWPSGLRDLDSGATVCHWWWEDSTDALTALEKLVRSEGPPAMLTMGADGAVVFRDRHHRLTETASLTSQQTWGQGLMTLNTPFSYDEAWSHIVNQGSASVDVRVPGLLQQVWVADSPITLAAGESKLITATTSDPVFDAVTPVDTVDFTTASGSVTATLLRTSGQSIPILLTPVGSAAVISSIQLRAVPVPVGYTVQVSAEDATSQDDYGTRSFPADLPWCNQYDAEAILSTAVALRAQPLPIISARFMVGRDTVKASVLARDLSDRVHVVEPETVTDGDFYVESIQHDLTGEHDHAVVFGLEAVSTPISPVFRFDTAGAGFNDGKFGAGIDDPANIFRFDGTSGHRFNEGVMAS